MGGMPRVCVYQGGMGLRQTESWPFRQTGNQTHGISASPDASKYLIRRAFKVSCEVAEIDFVFGSRLGQKAHC